MPITADALYTATANAFATPPTDDEITAFLGRFADDDWSERRLADFFVKVLSEERLLKESFPKYGALAEAVAIEVNGTFERGPYGHDDVYYWLIKSAVGYTVSIRHVSQRRRRAIVRVGYGHIGHGNRTFVGSYADPEHQEGNATVSVERDPEKVAIELRRKLFDVADVGYPKAHIKAHGHETRRMAEIDRFGALADLCDASIPATSSRQNLGHVSNAKAFGDGFKLYGRSGDTYNLHLSGLDFEDVAEIIHMLNGKPKQ